jgi:hypothetical protein
MGWTSKLRLGFVFNYLALPVTARNGPFRIPKLNVAGSTPVSRSQASPGRSDRASGLRGSLVIDTHLGGR